MQFSAGTGLNVAKLTPHVLRATAATLLRAAGVPIEEVQELLGHASPVTTQRYDRGQTVLDGHAVYRLTGLLTQQDAPSRPATASSDAQPPDQHDLPPAAAPNGGDPQGRPSWEEGKHG